MPKSRLTAYRDCCARHTEDCYAPLISVLLRQRDYLLSEMFVMRCKERDLSDVWGKSVMCDLTNVANELDQLFRQRHTMADVECVLRGLVKEVETPLLAEIERLKTNLKAEESNY